MRAIPAILVILLLAVGAYVWIAPGGETLAPPSGDDTETTQPDQPEVDSAAAERDRFATAPPEALEPESNETNIPAVEPDPATTLEQDQTVEITVANAATLMAIDSYRWSFRQPGTKVRGAIEQAVLRGEATQSTTTLALPRATIGDLLVEADGMQPFTQRAFATPQPDAPIRHLDVYLTPAALAAGITLRVHTVDQQPVPNVRVDAFQITESNRDSAWQLGQPLWARRTAAEDGGYELPPLPAGEYGILLVATDAEGLLLPLTPFRRTFVLNGNNGYLEDVTLEPACALQLELLDANGQPFDPSTHNSVTISLNGIGQTGLQRKWTTWRKQDGEAKPTSTVSEANRVPGVGIIWLDEPVAPGSYSLELVIDGAPRVNQTLLLRANERQLEQVYVR